MLRDASLLRRMKKSGDVAILVIEPLSNYSKTSVRSAGWLRYRSEAIAKSRPSLALWQQGEHMQIPAVLRWQLAEPRNGILDFTPTRSHVFHRAIERLPHERRSHLEGTHKD
jgi:hypothetical protein